MGEYEPNDSRDVTLTSADTPVEPTRTGEREGETREQETDAKAPPAGQYTLRRPAPGERGNIEAPSQPSSIRAEAEEEEEEAGEKLTGGEAQAAYGNSRDEQGRSEQDAAEDGKAGGGREAVSEGTDDETVLVDNPDAVARADAQRPLGGS